MGPDFVLVNISVDFSNRLSAGAVEDCIARLDSEIKNQDERIKKVFVEAEKIHTPGSTT